MSGPHPLARAHPRYRAFGMQRMVRDVPHIDGQVTRSSKGRRRPGAHCLSAAS